MRNRRAAAVAVLCAVVLALAGCTVDSPSVLPSLSGPQATARPSGSPSTPSGTASSSAPAPARPSTTAPHSNDLLALGDSITAGYQPGAGDDKTGGYVGKVLDAWREPNPQARLTNLACSGETTTSMQQGGRCTYPQGSQLKAALAELRQGNTKLVTISLGANDVLGCARAGIDTACAAEATTKVGAALTSILGQLRAAAPQATIVVLTYYDPLLASWRLGPVGRQLATTSLSAMVALNSAISAAGRPAGAHVADIAQAFSSADTSGTPTPVNVDRVCKWTWMCVLSDIHPNAAGYAVISGWVVSRM